MASLPTARQVNLISVILHFIIMAFVILAYFLAGSREFVIYGALTYLTISFTLRYFIPIDHRVGMRLVHKKEFRNAISYFKRSYAFFNKNLWIDKYRFVTLLSSSNMCYNEMALNNIAFCYSQVSEGDKA